MPNIISFCHLLILWSTTQYNTYLDENIEHDEVVLCIVKNCLNQRATMRTAVKLFWQRPFIIGTESKIKTNKKTAKLDVFFKKSIVHVRLDKSNACMLLKHLKHKQKNQ